MKPITTSSKKICLSVICVMLSLTTIAKHLNIIAPGIVAPIQGNTSPCVFSTTTLTCATPGGVWSTNGTNSTITQNGELSATSAASFTVYYTVTDSTGNSNYSFAVITPVANAGVITGDTAVCMPGTAQYTSSGLAGGTWRSSNIDAVGTINQSGLFTTILMRVLHALSI